MKRLYYAERPAYDESFLLDEAEQFARNGDDIVFAYCNGALSCCNNNRECRKDICRYCHFFFRHMKPLSSRIHVESIGADYLSDHSPCTFAYDSMDDIKALRYKGCYVGYGALSSYISFTRDSNPNINGDFRRYFDMLLDQACRAVDLAEKLFEKHRPDAVSIYNGRYFFNRGFFDLAIQRHIPIHCIEGVGGVRTGKPLLRTVFEDCLPQNLEFRAKLIKRLWEDDSEPVERKIEIGRSFFERRRNSIMAGDKVYTSGQQQGLLPQGFDPQRRNMMIFNSSEDEYMSLGDEYDKLQVYKNQLTAIRHILGAFRGGDEYFYLRIHPNQRGLPAVDPLLHLEKEFDNITVIPPESPISSYALVDAADVVVVFGSTIGAEACYWGKPVVLLCGAQYSHMGIASAIPLSPEEALHALADRSLKPGDRDAAIRYGYYIMSQLRLGIPSSYHHIKQIKLPFLKKSIQVCTAFRLCGSALLMRCCLEYLKRRSLRSHGDCMQPEAITK